MKYDLSKPIQRQKAIERMKHLLDKSERIELKQVRLKRGLNQNAYLHVCITLYAIEYGCDLEEMKQTLKHWYKLYKVNESGAVIYGKTSDMDTKELTTFIEWIRNHCAKNTGFHIPSSEMYIQEQIYYDSMINQHQQYL